MGLFAKRADPISERARALNAEIAALEEEIQRLDEQLRNVQARPRLRSTALPGGAAPTHSTQPQQPPQNRVSEPVFLNHGHENLNSKTENGLTADHFNEFGVRKYDLVGMLRRIRNHFRAPTPTNPRLVSYLAAGGIQGLRPLRYEKRVARNRFILLTTILFLVLLGIIATLVRR